MSEWQTFDSIAKTRKAILVFVAENQCCYAVYWDERRERWSVFGGDTREHIRDETITHWMPLPDPPQQKAPTPTTGK